MSRISCQNVPHVTLSGVKGRHGRPLRYQLVPPEGWGTRVDRALSGSGEISFARGGNKVAHSLLWEPRNQAVMATPLTIGCQDHKDPDLPLSADGRGLNSRFRASPKTSVRCRSGSGVSEANGETRHLSLHTRLAGLYQNSPHAGTPLYSEVTDDHDLRRQ